MIKHFTGQTSLIVKAYRDTPGSSQHAADQGPLVQVGVYDVKCVWHKHAHHPYAQQYVEGVLVPRRANFVVAVPRGGCGANDAEARDVVALVIGENRDVMPQRLQRACLFEDAYVAAVITKERGWRNAEDAQS